MQPSPSCSMTMTGSAASRSRGPAQRYSTRPPGRSTWCRPVPVAASFIRALSSGKVSQFKALDLAGRGLWQFVDEFDPARIFVGRQPFLDEGLQLLAERLVGADAVLQDDIGLRLDQIVGVGMGDHGGQIGRAHV